MRPDSTKLDDVAGRLSTIGDLNGLREGVRGVAECLRRDLAAVLEESSGSSDDGEPRFAVVVDGAHRGGHVYRQQRDITAVLARLLETRLPPGYAR